MEIHIPLQSLEVLQTITEKKLLPFLALIIQYFSNYTYLVESELI